MARYTLVLLAVLLSAALLAGRAQGGPQLLYGFSEDAPKWEGTTATTPERDLGAKAFRITLYWDPGETDLTTTNTDEIGRAVSAAQGMRVVVTILDDHNYKTPLDAAARTQYCTFARSVLVRFPSINDLIIWNEPNLTRFWTPQFNADGTSAAPAAYEALAARCYDVLHAYRAGVNVIGFATSNRGNDDPKAVSNISHSPLNFIREFGAAYRASGRTSPVFDTFSHHPYPVPIGERPWRTHTGTTISSGDWAKLMQTYHAAFDGTAQPVPGQCIKYRCATIWYMETGYQTIPDAAKASAYTGAENVQALPDYAGGEPDSPPPNVDSMAPDQATQVLDVTRLAYCQPYVAAVFNFLLWDESDLSRWQSAPFWADRTPKDSYPAFKQVIGEVNNHTVDCSKLKGGPIASPDTTAPAAPGALVARGANTKVSLTWRDSTESDVAGFNVYRSTKRGGPYVRLTTSLVTAAKYTDSGLVNGRPYYYVVTASDTMGNESARSNEAYATPTPWGF